MYYTIKSFLYYCNGKQLEHFKLHQEQTFSSIHFIEKNMAS